MGDSTGDRVARWMTIFPIEGASGDSKIYQHGDNIHH